MNFYFEQFKFTAVSLYFLTELLAPLLTSNLKSIDILKILSQIGVTFSTSYDSF